MTELEHLAAGAERTAMASTRTHTAEKEQTVDVAAALRTLWLGRRLLVAGSLLVGVLGLVVALLLPPSFTAVASFIPPSSQNSSSALAASLSSLSVLSPVKNSSDLYLGLLKSRSVADRLVKQFALLRVYKVRRESFAVKALAGHSTFEADAKSTIITVQVTDHDPERARAMAEAYLDEVRIASSSLALTESSQRRIFFEERLRSEKDELANAEVTLKQIQEKTGLIAPAGQTASEIQTIAQVRAEITGREVRLASLRRDETEENPDVQRVRNEIASLQGRLAELERGSSSGNLSTAQVPALALEYIRGEREVKYHNALFDIIAKQYENARLDEAHDPPLQVVDHAILPDHRSGPSRALMTLASLVLGALCSALWLLWKARNEVVSGPASQVQR